MKRILMVMLCLVMVISTIGTAAATGEENYIISSPTGTSIVPALIFTFKSTNGVNEIDQIIESEEFQDFRNKNGINATDYRMEIVSPNSTDSNLIMVTNGTHKWYYKVSSYVPTRQHLQNNIVSNTPNGFTLHNKVGDTPNRFTLHNSCSHTVYYVGVILYRFAGGWVPVGIQRIYRWNLPAGGVLNYWPGPDFTHVTINFTPHKGWHDHPRHVIPLGSWHNAYMFHDGSNYGWRF